MELEILWTQGKCDGEPNFISKNIICFRSGSFIKLCSTCAYKETSIQGPCGEIQCLSCDSELGLIALGNYNSSIFIISYPSFQALSHWKTKKASNFKQMCFAGNDYLLVLEGWPNFNLVLWNWRKGILLHDIPHVYPVESGLICCMSTYPGYNKIAAFQEKSCLHFFEIEDICERVNFERKVMYLPIVGDKDDSSLLDKKGVENVTFFDKMGHESWGIHSELLHDMPLKVLFTDLPERHVVEFYDFLTKHERLQISCHCWLPDKKLLVACLDGTVLLVALSDFSVKIIHFEDANRSEDGSGDYISCMALNKNNLFVATKHGSIFTVSNIEEWTLMLLASLKESPVLMRISPDYKNLLFFNSNSSIVLFETNRDENDYITYITTCSDNSRIVGICKYSDYCITARASGLVEAFELKTGAPISSFGINEDLVCMEAISSCSMILLTTSCSHLYAIEFTDIKNFRIVEKSKPSKEPIHAIRCEPYGRVAVLASYSLYVFIYNILPSRRLMIQGYLSLLLPIKDIAIVCRGIQDAIQVYLLGVTESEGDSIANFEIPEDFNKNYANYWENQSGKLSDESLKLKQKYLQTTCSCIAAHHTLGLILCLTEIKEVRRIPYEKIDSFSLEETKKCFEIPKDDENYVMLLSKSHDLLLLIDTNGELTIRDTQYFHIKSSEKYRTSFKSAPCIVVCNDVVIVEGIQSVVICSKLPAISEDMIWDLFRKALKEIEDENLPKMKPHSNCEAISWVEERLWIVNQDALLELKAKKKRLKTQFKEIKMKLHNLAQENFSMPPEHQIKSEGFVFDEGNKEKMLKSREEDIEKYTQVMKEKLDQARKNAFDIKEECFEGMMVKGKILKSFREGSLFQNYSISSISEKDKNEIRYSYKKMWIENYLQGQKSSEKESKSFEELRFEELSVEEDIVNLVKKLQKQPFQLQSYEERIDYVNILKYIILLKRLMFNHQFDAAAKIRKDTMKNIKEINNRIKEILPLIEDDRSVWEPIDEDDELMYEVSDEEVENASRLLLQKDTESCKGLADHILKEEWLLKRKFAEKQKYKVKLKKENIERLRKEADRKFKEIDGLVDKYEKRHSTLVEEKLLSDIEINKDELQLYLLLFSIANFHNFKQWERYVKECIQKIENIFGPQNETIKELENHISNYKKDVEKLENEVSVLDSEVKQNSNMSRNKQAFLEAYEKRPEISVPIETLNPYKNVEREIISPEILFQDLNASKNKPQKVPVALWKQLCSLRERKFALKKKINDEVCQIDLFKGYLKELKNIQSLTRKDIEDKKQSLQNLHELRIRCNFETPMVLSVPDSRVEMEYPDDLNFRQTLFLRRLHVESLNCILTNAGNAKLESVKRISKAEYQIEKNQAKVRINKLKLRDARKAIDVIKSIPMTKDIQKIIQNPKGFSLQDKIDALEKSKQMEIDEFAKQMNHVTERIANIEVKKDIFRKSLKEKKKEIEKLKGDIAELRKIEKLKGQPK